jgi:hypothetical protein
MSDKRWYLYHGRNGEGLSTSLIPPEEYRDKDKYIVTGPYGNKEIMDKFMEIHGANCEHKRKTVSKGG